MQQKNRRGLRQNLIFAALVLALAAGLALWRQATAAPAISASSSSERMSVRGHLQTPSSGIQYRQR